MAKVIEFPVTNLSEQDKKIVRLETYIRTNLIDMANRRRDLVALAKEIKRLQLRLVKNEGSDGKE